MEITKWVRLSKDTVISDKIIKYLLLFILLITLVYFGFSSFLMYHTLIEFLCVLTAAMMATIAVNTHTYSTDNKIIKIGIAYGFIALFDAIHFIIYLNEGSVNISSNDSIQIWVASRYIISISFLLAYVFRKNKLDLLRNIITYILISFLLFTSIFIFKIFPTSYIIGIGLTPSKIISELITCSIYVMALFLFVKNKQQGEDKYIILSILFSIFSTVLFSSYKSVGDTYDIFGHVFKLLSYYSIYLGLIKSSLKEPHNTLNKLNKLFKEENKNLEQLVWKLSYEFEQSEKDKNLNLRKKEILNSILESAGDGIIVISNTGKIIHINEQFGKYANIKASRIHTISRNQIIKSLEMTLVNSEKFDDILKDLWKTQGGYSSYLENKDGRKIEISSFPFIEKGVVQGKMFRVKDISDVLKIAELEKQVENSQAIIEKSKEYDELRNNFFSTVSHELRTPLTIILGVIQLFGNDHKDEFNCPRIEYTKKYIGMMKQNCYRLIKLASNLIDITKMDAGFFELKSKNLNVVAVIEEITLSVVDFARSKGLSLVFDTEVEEKIIALDAYSLERVMLNLLSNAVKFTDPGGKIEVTIKETEKNIRIIVKDDGIGIPEHMSEVIFDRFRQVDSSLRREKEGSGIGLSLVKNLLEKQGGRIYLNKEVVKGSEFIIDLPIIVNEDENNEDYVPDNTNVERINIEFSDIYELNQSI